MYDIIVDQDLMSYVNEPQPGTSHSPLTANEIITMPASD